MPGLAAQQDQVFRGTSDAVRVFVTVTDGDGRLVTNLPQRRLRDTRRRKAAADHTLRQHAAAHPAHRDAGCLGQHVGQPAAAARRSQQLFARLRTDDAVRVGTFGHEIDISPSFTRDPGELRTALPEAIAEDAPTPLWRATDEALGGLRRRHRGSPGRSSSSATARTAARSTSARRYVSQAEVIERARNEDVMVYAIGLRSRSMRPTMPGIGPAASRRC